MSRPQVTILGAGVTGLSCAYDLAEVADVTIVARNMPGDPPSLGWASPWAGAMWLATANSKPDAQRYQKDAYFRLMKVAEREPESSVKKIDIMDFRDGHKTAHNNPAFFWTFTNKFRALESHELENGAECGMTYETVVLTPEKFCRWLQGKCERRGIRFIRRDVVSLAEASAIAPCDVIVNASGVGSRFLHDVRDQKCHSVRGQTLVVKCEAKIIWAHHGSSYTYIIPRGDGTAILGGIKEKDKVEPHVNEEVQRDIHRRCHRAMPNFIPARFEELKIVRHNVGFRPETDGAVRVEAEVKNGMDVVHVYGMLGGYVYGFGVSLEVSSLVQGLIKKKFSPTESARL